VGQARAGAVFIENSTVLFYLTDGQSLSGGHEALGNLLAGKQSLIALAVAVLAVTECPTQIVQFRLGSDELECRAVFAIWTAHFCLTPELLPMHRIHRHVDNMSLAVFLSFIVSRPGC
jgi:hypothetical protein